MKSKKFNQAEKEKSKEDKLLEEINKQGYILEERVEKILEGISRNQGETLKKRIFLERNYLINEEDNEREIDVLLVVNNTCFIIECKKSVKSWFFGISNKEKDKSIYYLYLDNQKKGIFWDIQDSEKMPVTKPFFSALSDEGGNLQSINKNKEFQISQRDLDKALRQSAKNVEAIANKKEFVDDLNIKYLKQIIVTNSDLFTFEYDQKDIDSRGNLTKIKNLNKRDFLACNRKEPIKIRDPLCNSNNALLTTIWTNLENLKDIILNETFTT